MQEKRKSIAYAMELRFSCTNPQAAENYFCRISKNIF